MTHKFKGIIFYVMLEGEMAVSWRKDGIYGFVVLDNPPVNAINREIRQGLLDAVDWAEREGLERVILSGAGPAFAAGADAKEFDRAPEAPHLPDVLNRIESSTVPWIAALHGNTLFELLPEGADFSGGSRVEVKVVIDEGKAVVLAQGPWFRVTFCETVLLQCMSLFRCSFASQYSDLCLLHWSLFIG